MELVVLVPSSLYNKSLNTQSVTKQELPKYQPLQNPTYQTDSLKKEINQKNAKADSSVHKFVSCPRNKLSSSQTLIWDGTETGIFLSDFAQQLRRKNADVPDFYFTLLGAAGISPNLNQNVKAKGTESCVFFKIGTSETAKALHTGWCCLWVSAQLKKGWQSVSIKSETIFTYKTFLNKIFSCHIWCEENQGNCWIQKWNLVDDLAYVDNLAKDNNGVKYLLVRQNQFDRTVAAKKMRTKDSKEAVCANLTKITIKNRPKKVWSLGKQNLLKSLEIFAKQNEYNFQLQWERRGLHFLSYKTVPEKYALPLHGIISIQVHSKTDSIRTTRNSGRKI